MHAMSGELDMRKFGALRKHLPYTHWTYLIGTLAIAGIFPFAGFFSKDEILLFSMERGLGFWVIGAGAAILTSFYMFRSVFMTFYGESRVEPHALHHLHESPFIMTGPLILLAFLSLVGGFVGIPPVFSEWLGFHADHTQFAGFLAPVFHASQQYLGAPHHPSHAMELILMIVSLAIAIIGLCAAYWMYVKDTAVADRMVKRFGGLHTLVYNKYWIDELYDFLFVNSIVRFSRFLWKSFDDAVIDGIVNGSAAFVQGWGSLMRRVQTGLVKDYAMSILFGVLVVISYLVFK